MKVHVLLLELVDIDHLLVILLLGLKYLLELLDLILELLVLLLLHDKLSHKQFTVILLSLKILPQLRIFLDEQSIFIINSLSNGSYQLQVMLHFIFSLFQITLLIALEGFLFLKSLFHLEHFRVELSDNVTLLLLLQFF